jgi:hypothetical protein
MIELINCRCCGLWVDVNSKDHLLRNCWYKQQSLNNQNEIKTIRWWEFGDGAEKPLSYYQRGWLIKMMKNIETMKRFVVEEEED